MRRLWWTVTVLMGFSSATTAAAGSWYVGLEAGMQVTQDQDAIVDFSILPAAKGTIEYESGWAASGTLGWESAEHWRVEVEGRYGANSVDRHPTLSDSDLSELSLFANALYDVTLSPTAKFTLGGGVGYDLMTFEVGNLNDTVGRIACQGILGGSIAISPRADLTAAYHLRRISGPDFRIGALLSVGDSDDLTEHALSVGVRLHFGGGVS